MKTIDVDYLKSVWCKRCDNNDATYGCPYMDGTCGTLEFFDRIQALQEINKDKILKCCHEIEMCLCNCFNTGSILLKCDIDFIVKQLDFIRKELNDGGSKTD